MKCFVSWVTNEPVSGRKSLLSCTRGEVYYDGENVGGIVARSDAEDSTAKEEDEATAVGAVER